MLAFNTLSSCILINTLYIFKANFLILGLLNYKLHGDAV